MLSHKFRAAELQAGGKILYFTRREDFAAIGFEDLGELRSHFLSPLLPAASGILQNIISVGLVLVWYRVSEWLTKTKTDSGWQVQEHQPNANLH